MTKIRKLPVGQWKRIWMSRKRALRGEPAWVVELVDAKGPGLNEHITARNLEFRPEIDSTLPHRMWTRQPPDEPLYPDGPAYWFETKMEILALVD